MGSRREKEAQLQEALLKQQQQQQQPTSAASMDKPESQRLNGYEFVATKTEPVSKAQETEP